METSRDDLARHERARDDLLTHIARVLMDDPRIVAAWLTGSLAYGTADAWSDLDLHVIVADEHYTDIVARREDLYARFGQPVLIPGIKVNTESPAHFNLLVYPGGLEVDCSLWPRTLAHRPTVARLLFDRVGIPVDSAPTMSDDERRREIEHQVNFFWAMAVVAVKCVGRGYTTGAALTIEMLTDAYDTVWRLVWLPDHPHPEAIARRHRAVVPELISRTPRLGRAIDPLGALDVIRQLCADMEQLHQRCVSYGAATPTRMPADIAAFATFAEEVVREEVVREEVVREEVVREEVVR